MYEVLCLESCGLGQVSGICRPGRGKGGVAEIAGNGSVLEGDGRARLVDGVIVLLLRADQKREEGEKEDDSVAHVSEILNSCAFLLCFGLLGIYLCFGGIYCLAHLLECHN